MLKKGLVLFLAFIFVTEAALSLSNKALQKDSDSFNLKVSRESTNTYASANLEEPIIFAALPSFDQQIKTSIKTADARPEIIRQYLHQYQSPLEPHADLIVQLSDRYNFDYRWLVAIAQQESSLCKFIPENSYNCWGWGIYGDKITRFSSYEDALTRIAPQFTRIFLKGNHTKDPAEVMKTYTPPSDGSWANGVATFFDRLD